MTLCWKLHELSLVVHHSLNQIAALVYASLVYSCSLSVYIVLFVFTTNCILRVSSLFAWFVLKLFWLIRVYKVSRFIPCQQHNTCYWELWDLVNLLHQMELFISWSESCTHVLQIVFKPEDKVSDSLCTRVVFDVLHEYLLYSLWHISDKVCLSCWYSTATGGKSNIVSVI